MRKKIIYKHIINIIIRLMITHALYPALPLPLQICGELHHSTTIKVQIINTQWHKMFGGKVLKEICNWLKEVPLEFPVFQQSVWTLINMKLNRGQITGMHSLLTTFMTKEVSHDNWPSTAVRWPVVGLWLGVHVCYSIFYCGTSIIMHSCHIASLLSMTGDAGRRGWECHIFSPF